MNRAHCTVYNSKGRVKEYELYKFTITFYEGRATDLDYKAIYKRLHRNPLTNRNDTILPLGEVSLFVLLSLLIAAAS